jgi:hypothetical protein
VTDESLFPASEKIPGQAESRKAYSAISEQLREFVWWQDYLLLRDRGWDWRKAVYIAWASSPTIERQPATQEGLAQQVLGLASDRIIRKWRENEPAIDNTVVEFQAAPLLRHRRDIFEALIKSASDPDPKSHADRKLALEMMGDYKPKQQTEITGKDGEALIVEYVNNWRDED